MIIHGGPSTRRLGSPSGSSAHEDMLPMAYLWWIGGLGDPQPSLNGLSNESLIEKVLYIDGLRTKEQLSMIGWAVFWWCSKRHLAIVNMLRRCSMTLDGDLWCCVTREEDLSRYMTWGGALWRRVAPEGEKCRHMTPERYMCCHVTPKRDMRRLINSGENVWYFDPRGEL